MGCETPEKAIAGFREMMRDMDLHNPVACDKDEDLKVLSISVNPVRLRNNPIDINEHTAFLLYSAILM